MLSSVEGIQIVFYSSQQSWYMCHFLIWLQEQDLWKQILEYSDSRSS